MQNIGNYFDPYASTLPTLHFWSLSIEFQVWLLFIFLGKLLQTKYLRKNLTVMFFLLAPIILFTLFIIERRIFKQIDIDTFAFYSTSIRGLELLLGAGIFVFFKRKIYSFQLTLDQNVLMILMLFLMLIDFNKSVYLQITILALTSLFLMQCNPDQFAQTDTLAKIGGYAYIVYLLHWPTIVYLNRFIENRYILTGLVLLLLILVCPQLKNIETFYIKISKQK